MPAPIVIGPFSATGNASVVVEALLTMMPPVTVNVAPPLLVIVSYGVVTGCGHVAADGVHTLVLPAVANVTKVLLFGMAGGFQLPAVDQLPVAAALVHVAVATGAATTM